MAGSLAKRIITAAVLVPVVLGLVFYGDNTYLAVGFGLVVLGCAWEWSGMNAWGGALRWSYTVSLGVLLYLVWSNRASSEALVLVGVIWWAMSIVLVVFYQRGPGSFGWITNPLVLAISGWLILVPAWTALILLHVDGRMGVAGLVILFLLIWGADSGAYFAGRGFGKTKLASRVSPGKTWEGIGAAVLVALAIGGVGGWWLQLGVGSTGVFMVLCVITVAISVVGDLTESLFKREAGVKDSGTLLPGHGGLLDRVDSLTAAAPVFLFSLRALL